MKQLENASGQHCRKLCVCVCGWVGALGHFHMETVWVAAFCEVPAIVWMDLEWGGEAGEEEEGNCILPR